MKARILAAILLMFTFTTAYNQTSRRGERNNDNRNNQQTERKEQNKEATKPERTEQPKNDNSEKRGTSSTQDSQRSQRVSRDNNNRQQPQQQPQQPNQTSRRGGQRNENSRSRKDDNNKRVVVHEENRQPERKVVIHEYNREPQRKVVVRDNRREERTYVRIDRPVRKVVVVNHPKNYRPVSVEYRRVHKPYRAPVHTSVYWSVSLHNDFRIFYPEVRVWRYDIGYSLPVVPAYDADYYIGDVARVYGKVYDIYYERETDEYYLYFGDYFPYQDFSVVINGREARAYSRRPERFFRRANLTVTGYITDYDDKPEIVVRRASQIELY